MTNNREGNNKEILVSSYETTTTNMNNDDNDNELTTLQQQQLHQDIDINDELEASYQTSFKLGQIKEEQEEMALGEQEIPDMNTSVKMFKKRMYKMSVVSLLCMCVAYVMVVVGNTDKNNNSEHKNLTMRLFDFKSNFAFLGSNNNGPPGLENLGKVNDQNTDVKWSKMLNTDAEDDKIKNLPGLSEKMKSQMYSGYLEISDSKKVFYWFTESENDPENDHMVMWTNGGPGCSGMLGNLAEHGPLRITNSNVLKYNKYRWTQAANMLYIEIPYGVGFSYTTLDHEGAKQVTDQITMEDNYLVLNKFFEKHSSFRRNKLILAGESFAGHYIPQLSQYILDKQSDQDETALKLNLKGMLVGNPLVDPVENVIGSFEAKKGRSMLSDTLYKSWIVDCYSKLAGTNSEDNKDLETMMTGNCLKYQINAQKETGDDYDPYGLDFDVCESDYSTYGAHIMKQMTKAKKLDVAINSISSDQDQEESDIPDEKESEEEDEEAEGLDGRELDGIAVEELDTNTYDACTEDYLTTWMNTPSVQTALHAKTGSKWSMCSDTVNYDAGAFYTYVEPVYDELFNNKDFHMLIYSGDDDSVCGTAGTQYWMGNMDWEHKDSWRPWYNTDKTNVAGYATTYEKNNYFVTVHGAGHMVPSYKAESAYTLFTGYLSRV